MNEPKDPEAAEPVKIKSIKAVDPAAICSPPRSTVEIHRALQRARPLLAMIQMDAGYAEATREFANDALAECDIAMLSADCLYPDFDFYALNTEGQATAKPLPAPDGSASFE